MGKLTQCTICNCHWVNEVNDMLKKKTPYSVVLAYLKDKGIKLSNMSVSRHKNNCLLTKKKPRQIQKKRIMNAQIRAKGKQKMPPEQALRKEQRSVYASQNVKVPNSDELRRRKSSYMTELKKMEEDLDVINEFLFVLAASKDRVQRAIDEEEESGLVLGTTGVALKDYANAVAKFHEITAGMESLAKLRFAQLSKMVGDIFTQPDISDVTRLELLTLLDEAEGKEDEEPIEAEAKMG